MSSIENALKLIELIVSHQAEGLTFTEIITHSGLPRSSSHRLLKELTALNLLTHDPETRTYRGRRPGHIAAVSCWHRLALM